MLSWTVKNLIIASCDISACIWAMFDKKDPAEAISNGRRGGSTTKKPYRFSIHDIAAAKDKSVSAVRKDRQRGKFDPNDLLSLSEYISDFE